MLKETKEAGASGKSPSRKLLWVNQNGNCWYTAGSFRKSGKQKSCSIPHTAQRRGLGLQSRPIENRGQGQLLSLLGGGNQIQQAIHDVGFRTTRLQARSAHLEREHPGR